MNAQPSAFRTVAILLGVVFSYAVTRYVIFGSVAAIEIPFYIMNKVLAVTGTLLLSWGVGMGAYSRMTGKAKGWNGIRAELCLWGFGLIGLHIVSTLFLSGPEYFPKFFQAASNRMNFVGQLASFSGVVSLGILAVLALTSLKGIRRAMAAEEWKRMHRLSSVAMGLVVIHIAVIAVPSWLTIEKWPFYMLPLTLISSVAAAWAATIRPFESLVWEKRDLPGATGLAPAPISSEANPPSNS